MEVQGNTVVDTRSEPWGTSIAKISGTFFLWPRYGTIYVNP